MHLSQVKISNTSRDRANDITFLNVCSTWVYGKPKKVMEFNSLNMVYHVLHHPVPISYQYSSSICQPILN